MIKLHNQEKFAWESWQIPTVKSGKRELFALILLNSREYSGQLDQQASGKANSIDFSTKVSLSSEEETAVG